VGELVHFEVVVFEAPEVEVTVAGVEADAQSCLVHVLGVEEGLEVEFGRDEAREDGRGVGLFARQGLADEEGRLLSVVRHLDVFVAA